MGCPHGPCVALPPEAARALGTRSRNGETSRTRQRPDRGSRQPPPLVALAAGGLIMPPFTKEAGLKGLAVRQAQADAFARSLAGTIAELEREGITSSKAMAKALNERGVATLRSRSWGAQTVINLRRRLKQLGL
jgi:hypothetical protein